MKNQYKALYDKLKSGDLDGINAKNAIQQLLVNTEEENSLYHKTLMLLKSVLSPIIKVPVERIEEEAAFDEYGINSIMIMDMTEELEKTFKGLSQTLFYECSNVKELTYYFINNYNDVLQKRFVEKKEPCKKDNQRSVEKAVPKPVLKDDKAKEAKTNEEDIAIIGIAGSYPDSDDLDALWENLRNGKDCIREIPKDRWDYKKYYSENKNEGAIDSKWGGFLNEVDEFDSLLFHISPVEADKMDPQERIFLQCVYHLFEDAGYTKKTLKKDDKAKVGVYVGVMYEEYQFYGVEEQQKHNEIALGGNAASIANRISYVFNLNGPSIAINTMCSSSLTTIHLACQSIKSGECDVAVAGGVNISIHPNKYITLAQGNFASSKGRCESFGNSGDGYVPGEGVGAVLIKPLSRAIEDGDHIYGVIKGSAINHGGRTNGYTVPNPNMQAEVIESALKQANMNPRTISYLEAHGTGTILGDPIEIAGLEKVYKKYSGDVKYCSIGSVKSNIGHCEGAAGVAAITKVLLQMKYKKLVPSLHAEVLNKKIDFEHSPFVVQQDLQDWEKPEIEIDGVTQTYPRRAGISAFGAGGSNAHIILEEYDEAAEQILENYNKPYMIVLSARTKKSLYEACNQLLSALEAHKYQESDLPRIAYTLQVGREEMHVRTGFVISSIEELKEALKERLSSQSSDESCFKEVMELTSEDRLDREYQLIQYIQQKNYDEVVKLWEKGCLVDWNLFYSEKKPVKISLPTYVFEKKKHWYKKREAQKESVMLYEPVWKTTAQDNLEAGTSKRVFFVYRASAIPMLNILDDYYQKAGAFTQRMIVHEDVPCDFGFMEKEEFDTIFYLSEMGVGKVENINQDTIYFLQFAKAVKKYARAKKKLNCYILTFNNYGYKETPVHLMNGGITGVTYSLAQSSVGLKVRSLDLSVDEVNQCVNKDKLAQTVIGAKPSASGEVVIVRDLETYRQNFRKIALPAKETFSSDGVYVILGGTGTVGSIITRFMIRNHNAKIVWLGRKDKDAKEVKEKQRSCAFCGNEPAYVQADVTDYDQVKTAISQIRNTYGKIRGAIFSGVVFDIHNEIATTTIEQFERILEVKTNGSMNFYNVLEQDDLDFLCYFSSGQSFDFSPAGNLCAYASGITFTDTLVRYLQKKAKFPVGCINWGFWKSSVSEAFGKNLDNCIEDEQGFEMFSYAAAVMKQQSASQIVCMDLEHMKGSERYLEKDTDAVSILAHVNQEYDTSSFTQEYGDRLELPKDLEDAIVRVLGVRVKNALAGKLSEKYVLWMDECKRILEEHIELEQGGIVSDSQIEDQWNKVAEKYSAKEDYKVSIRLLNECLNNLSDILEGKVAATDVIFPNGTMELVESIYSQNSIEDFYNEVLADYVIRCMEVIKTRKKTGKIRILEVGAGTGGTSCIVLKKLAPYRDNVEYYYTDISNSFLVFAKDKFSEYRDFMTFKIWNAEEAYQGTEKFDIILATNVLHSTRNMRQTLQNIHNAMSVKSILLVNEITDKNLVETLTFGLLDGWWKFDDPECRILGSPLLSNAKWKEVLNASGFSKVVLPLEHSAKIKQQVILAEHDGIVTENLPLKTETEKVKKVAAKKVEAVTYRNDMKKQDSKKTSFKGALEKDVKAILGEVLNLEEDEIKSNEAFSDYGLDSILGSSFIGKLNDTFHIELNNAILFDYTSAQLLADYVLECYPEQVEQIYGATQDVKEDSVPVEDIVYVEEVLQEDRSSEKEEYVGSNRMEADCKIAVIGMSGQFPDASTVEELWNNLLLGKNCVHELPKEYLDIENYYDSEQQTGKTYCKWGGILSEKEYFEPLFFNISPRDAADMSIHQRLILQEGWKAIEDAGYNPKTLSGSKTGVYIGAEPVKTVGDSFVGSSDAIVSSRLSYLLNLNGPALTVNTGCSSSAAAIHLACESLKSGAVDMALAGGIYADLNQQSLIALSAIGMLSKSGKCHTFDESADGTVMSEGVGVVVLKRLEDAKRDGDPIYGVIVASGMNQDGASNGITAPNGLSQEKLIREVYEQANIDPNDISYIETHGTGTKLGDPVEFNALDRIYKKSKADERKCVLGSVKTNIGHTGAASGVIGLIKVLLCLQHKEYPGMYGFETTNSLIELEQSVFEINTENEKWISGAKPRMAAINSFGHSGTNVHIVVEEYSKSTEAVTVQKSQFVPISANCDESLKKYCEKLADWIDYCGKTVKLNEVAYTLQNGREDRTARVIFFVSSIEELSCNLRKFVQSSAKEVPNCWYHNVKNEKNNLEFLSGDEDFQFIISSWYKKGLYSQIAKWWINGNEIDWKQLFGISHKEHIPSYAFKNQRYSIKSRQKAVTVALQEFTVNSKCRGLLQENCSDFSSYKYRSCFTGEEKMLSDHVMNGKRIFPGTAYMVMAMEAFKRALGSKYNQTNMICLEKVVMVNPLVVDGKTELVISLHRSEERVTAYRIEKDEKMLLNQGTLKLLKNQEKTVDLVRIRERCRQKELTKSECYNAFQKAGFHYGETFRGIEKLYFNQNEALAEIHFMSNEEGYLVHPGLLDSALQAVAGLNSIRHGDMAQLPYVIEKCVIRKEVTQKMWSYVQCREDKGRIQYDIELCDEQGKSLISIYGYSMRSLKKADHSKEQVKEELLIMTAGMETIENASEADELNVEKVVILTRSAYEKTGCQTDVDKLEHYILEAEDNRNPDEKYESYACQLINALKKILMKYANQNVFIKLFYDKDEPYCQGLGSILKTAKCEHPNVLWETVCLADNFMQNHILYVNRKMLQKEIVLGNTKSQMKRLTEVAEEPKVYAPWKDKKVYLITGGAGKLGLLFAKDIVSKAKNVTIILLGRSELKEATYNEIADLNQNGACVVYYRADITNAKAVKQVLESVRNEYDEVEGIIHCAGIIKDSLILKTDLGSCKEVLDVKVKGFQNLHEASKDMKLSFFVCCSSYAAAFGNVGQVAYAGANAYMDSMAVMRNEAVRRGECYGKTLSINWPYWKDGGMRVPAEKLEKVYQYTGMSPLNAETGLKALYTCMNTMEGQVIILQGDKNKMKETLFEKQVIKQRVESKADTSKASVGGKDKKYVSRERLMEDMKKIVSGIIEVSVEDVDVITEFGEYGFDSVTYTEFSNAINEAYHISLLPTVFYEFNNIEKLGEYIEKEYGELEDNSSESNEEYIEPERNEIEFFEQSYEEAAFDEEQKDVSEVYIECEVADNVEKQETERKEEKQKIAIVGVSAQFPGAKDIDQYWDNLKDGKESIQKVPKERWDWREYYGNPQREPGKTNVIWGGFIEGVDQFDPLFFGISPKQAELMDPKQRLILQHAWKAIEDAGYAPSSLAGTKTGVFIGTGASEYGTIIGNSVNIKDGYSVVGNASAMEANRISYFLDLHGPSEPVDTACSSSLIALHRAVRAIRSGECEGALVGGCNIMLTPDLHIGFSRSNMLSVDGHCKTFSDKADGYVRGEGVGVVYLKPLNQAIEDHDHIYGVILGTSDNHGGKANSITAPNPIAQRQVLKEAYEDAGIHPSTVTYVEAHGTGTELGDPIEYNCLCESFAEEYKNSKKIENANGCGLGSVKTNIGHLEFASGIAGLIKVLLQLKHKTIVKTLNCQQLNPYLKTEGSPFYIVRENQEWRQIMDEHGILVPRRAGISSFGFGGSNAHIVLEEYVNKEEVNENTKLLFLPFSAKTEQSLRMVVRQFIKAIKAGKFTDSDMKNIAFTLQNGREQMSSRLLIIAEHVSVLENYLEQFLQSDGVKRVYGEETLSFDGNVDISNWKNGKKVNWNKGKDNEFRISIPTYEFEKKSYWVTEQFQNVKKNKQKDIFILDKNWKIGNGNVIINYITGKIIVFSTQNTVSLASKIFEQTRLQPILLQHNTSESEVENQVNFYSSESCEKAYRSLKDALGDERIKGILDLTAYDPEYEESYKVESGKITVLQKVLEDYGKDNIRILQVTYHLQNLFNEQPSLSGSRTFGLYKMLQAEYKTVRASVMDSDLALTDIDLLAEQIRIEFFNMEEEVTECCFREQKRYIPVMKNCQTFGLDELPESKISFMDTILITGGLGGIGRSLCSKLIQLGVKKIVLFGREKLVDTSEKLLQIDKWKQVGADIQYYDVDMKDVERLKQAVDSIHSTFGRIDGVFHCAGVTGNNPMFHRKSIPDICEVCEPKIEGIRNLDKVLEQDKLSYFIMFSSVSAGIPRLSVGISDYAMANSYMDSFAEYKRTRTQTYYKAIQWPVWEQVGMSKGIFTGTSNNMGIPSLLEDEALRILLYILESKCDGKLPCKNEGEGLKLDELLKVPAPVYPKAECQNLHGKKIEDSLEFTKEWIRSLFMKELKIEEEKLEDNTSFEEYGVDSIVIAQLVDTMQNQLQTKLPSSLLIENHTLSELYEYFMENHKEEIEQMMLRENKYSCKTAEQEAKEEVKQEVKEDKHIKQEGLAIVGISCRFPESSNKEEFFDVLSTGEIMINEKPVDRWIGKETRKDIGGWVEDTNLFDEAYFGINPKDAAVMDPQARVVLEESLKAIYDAGYETSQIRGEKAGVFIGGRGHQSSDLETILSANNPILGMGNNYMASNISRFFDFKGPCMVVDTACSSGITALMMADDALRQGRINMAVVGAVSLLDDSLAHDVFEKRNILSKDGTFKVFSEGETGDVLGEGCGVVVVKRLKDAIKDGNRIYGVVNGIGVNNNGKTLGPGSPSIEAQKEVMKEALALAGKTPEQIDYIEVNGGGTVLMDSIEIKALSEVYDLKNKNLKPCILGCVKPNIGHLLLASGMASFIRCILSISKKEIPPFISAEEPFDEYNFEDSRVRFNRSLENWNASGTHPRCAAMNVFPDGGTNYHVIMEEFIPDDDYVEKFVSKDLPKLTRRDYSSKMTELADSVDTLSQNVWGEVKW